MKLILSALLVALVAGIVCADDAKGPKVTDKVSISVLILQLASLHTHTHTHETIPPPHPHRLFGDKSSEMMFNNKYFLRRRSSLTSPLAVSPLDVL